jgi:hypothetical protein
MPKTDYSTARTASLRQVLPALLLLLALLPCKQAFSTDTATTFDSTMGESLSGYYAREGNNGSPAVAAGNNIYIRFFPEQWLGMMFLPYPYAEQVASTTIHSVFDTARAQASGSAYLRGTFGELDEKATLHIERYGYLEDRVLFECGSLAPCTIRFGDGYIELIKPGMINEHIIRYNPVVIE